jgi:formate dehydrogenase iron-sulfur subunit
MVAEGKKHVETLKAKGHKNAYLYGEKEVGGTHVLYVLDDVPEMYGLPANPQVSAATIVWKDVIQPLGWAVGGLTILGLGMNYLVARANAKKEEK